MAVRIPAPTATSRRSPASRAIAHASGAAAAPISANGRFDASVVGPRAQMNGTITIDASGIQWAFDGTGRTGFAGIVPPTSGKIQTKSTLKPWPAASCRATSTYVRGVGIGGIGEARADDQAHHQGEQEQQDGRAHSAVHGSTGWPSA